MRKLLKWLSIALLVVVLLAGVFILSLDGILRLAAENVIHGQTGLQVEIGRLHVGLLQPVMTIRDFRLHNPPEFGGSPFLDIPEIHVEYDRAALRSGQLHINLIRFNLREFSVVKNEAGKTNIFAMNFALPKTSGKKGEGKPGAKALDEVRRQTGVDFKGIDVLNVTFGSAKFIDLANPANDREQKFGINNFVVKNIRGPGDLAGLGVLLSLRSGDFFKSTFGSRENPW